jgi:hypothetical protein
VPVGEAPGARVEAPALGEQHARRPLDPPLAVARLRADRPQLDDEPAARLQVVGRRPDGALLQLR